MQQVGLSVCIKGSHIFSRLCYTSCDESFINYHLHKMLRNEPTKVWLDKHGARFPTGFAFP